MFIEQIQVKHYRSIVNETLPCDSLTALVGRNGSGKSSFLSALALFYEPSATVAAEDFYNEDITQNIEIAITFGNLAPEARMLFDPYIDQETLTVVRVFSLADGKKSGTYYGMRLHNPDFEAVRSAGSARDALSSYAVLKNRDEFSSLPTARSAEAVKQAMDAWETNNPDKCERMRDQGQFFGFRQVAQGYLGRFTQFISIPAVRDAQSDATEGRGSSVTQIMDLVVRSVLANRQSVVQFRHNTREQYSNIMDPTNLTELNDLETRLSETLQSFVPDASVVLNWSQLPEIDIPMPQAQVKLLEDDYEAKVERTGHGLQRAYILTMLQHLVAARKEDSSTVSDDSVEEEGEGEQTLVSQLPNLVLAIEEPELYQHPSRQRHLATVLLKLATGGIAGVAESTQVLYATHSPLFVGLDRFDQIRVLQKTSLEEGKPKVTRLKRADMDAVAAELGYATNSESREYDAESLAPRLQAIMTPWMGEGFFADVVVLVEGEDDRAAILGVAASKGYDFDSMGITVIPCSGKLNLDRPLVIFRQLGIPAYVVWDGDSDSSQPTPESNRHLLHLLGQPEEDWPNFVGISSACFKERLEKTLEDEIGQETFNQLLVDEQQRLSIAKKAHALKNPVVIQRIIEAASSQGKPCPTLEGIVDNIISLKG